MKVIFCLISNITHMIYIFLIQEITISLYQLFTAFSLILSQHIRQTQVRWHH